MSALIEIENLTVSLGAEKLVDGLGFRLEKGASIGLLGESGSGKSLTVKAIAGLLPKYFGVSGRVSLAGRDLLGLAAGQRRALRGRTIGYIMQNPMTAFDPLMTIGGQMLETYRAHFQTGTRQARQKALATLDSMLIRDPERVVGQYPHELSGGMLQRVMIGLTISLAPRIIIADEPTTALDVITQAGIMNLFVKIKKEEGASIIFVSHDLGVVSKVADDILVLNKGRAVEYGPLAEVFAGPKSEHTQYLFSSRLRLMARFHQVTEGAVFPCS